MTALDTAREFARLFGRKLTSRDVNLSPKVRKELTPKPPRDLAMRVVRMVTEATPPPPEYGPNPRSVVCGDCHRLILPAPGRPLDEIRAHAFGCQQRVRIVAFYKEHDPIVLAPLQAAKNRVEAALARIHDARVATKPKVVEEPRTIMEFEKALADLNNQEKAGNENIRAQAAILESFK